MSTNWLAIDTAPKDTRILLYCPGRGAVFGQWKTDEYATKPRPYWTNDLEQTFGTRWTRDDQPTHWAPMPESPA